MRAAAHVEHQQIPGRRLGRRPADRSRPLLRLGDVLTGVVPPHSATADHLGQVTDWGLYGNDRWGDCGPTAVANSRKLATHYLTGAEQSPTQDDVLALYRASGNPGFDPVTGADDNGVDMPTMLSAVLAHGIGAAKGIAYAAVDVTDLDQVRAAISIFGFLLLGVDLEQAQQAQTDSRLWDYHRSGDWGGHAVLAGAYTSAARGADVSVVTWAEVVGCTDTFWRHQVQEAYVLVWPEHLGTAAFQAGVDQVALANAFQGLTGRLFPVTPAPPVPAPPSPGPAVDPRDVLVADVLAAADRYRAATGH